tara:strand:+ start:1079 stop:1216 length:138 start_codon:yes stop_codon:yes gene_type:complete
MTDYRLNNSGYYGYHDLLKIARKKEYMGFLLFSTCGDVNSTCGDY